MSHQKRMSYWILAAVCVYFCTLARCQTDPGDTAALLSLSKSLFPELNSADAVENWNSTFDPCGTSSCGTTACSTSDWRLRSEPPACNWTGICCEDWRVSGVVLASTKTTSTSTPWLSNSLQNLTALTTLSLPERGLSGTLPAGVGNLSSLTTLNLAGNNLGGFLPSSWGHLSNLSTLDLSNNALKGLIPITWCVPSQNAVVYKHGLSLAANTGLCSAPSSQYTYYNLPTCNPTTLQAQYAADPAAFVTAPAPPPNGIVQTQPSQTNDSSDSSTVKLIWPFVILAIAGLILALVLGLHRKSRTQQRGRRSHSRSRRATADDSANVVPDPPPVLVLGPDGTLLALGIRDNAADDVTEIHTLQSNVSDKNGDTASGIEAGHQIQAASHVESTTSDQHDGPTASASDPRQPLPHLPQHQQQERVNMQHQQSEWHPWAMMYAAHVLC